MVYDVVIIGAGFGGLIAAVELEAAGISSYLIFEKNKELGGVWYTHTYPGAASDVHTDFYSIRQHPNRGWSQRFPGQEEILEYLQNIAGKTGIRKKIRFDTCVTNLVFIETWNGWEVHDDTGQIWQAHSIVLATGPFRLPSIPAIPGLPAFKGNYFHSARWNHATPVAGKKVVVIGTGSSAAQIVPAIASVASELLVVQRTPAWILPKWNKPRAAWKQKLFTAFPFLQSASRSLRYYILEIAGNLFMKRQPHHAFLTWLALRKLRREVEDPAIRRPLTPSYPLGCKRIVLSDDFYPCFNLPHVHLVTEAVEAILPDGIQTAQGNYPADVIIFATGYNVANLDNYITITGRNGLCLNELWEKDGPAAYRGVQFSGFPHLCMQLGPNSGSYHTSVLHIIALQMKFWVKFLQWKQTLPGCCIDVRKDTQDAYEKNIRLRLRNTVWSDNDCKGWHLNRKGVDVVHFPGLAAAYGKTIGRLTKEDYEVVPAQQK